MSERGRPTWRSAAGILAAAFALSLAAVAWQLIPILRSPGQRAVGDTKHVETYGFDLSSCLIPCAEIVPAGMAKDGVPVLRRPRLLTVAGVDSLNRAGHARYLVSADRVIGMVLRGAARAYPVRVLCWHEVADDTLGGVPVAVAYNPLCDAAAAFERAVPGDTLDFGVSGLLWNSCPLLYDRRREPIAESLWSVLQGRAVAGPAAAVGRALVGLPLVVVRWDDWRARHPETTVLFPEETFRERYRRDPYGPYWNDDRLRFPVRPLPPKTGPSADLALKEPVVAVTAGGKTVAYPLRAIAARIAAGEGAPRGEEAGGGIRGGSWTTAQGGVALRFDYRDEPPAVAVSAVDSAAPIPVVQAFWFAWYAQHPDGELLWP